MAFHIVHDNRVGGQRRPRAEEAPSLVGREVVEKHRQKHVVEPGGTEREMSRVGLDDPDFGKRTARRLRFDHHLVISIHANDPEVEPVRPRPPYQGARRVAAAAAHIEKPDGLAPVVCQQSPERTEDAPDPAEVAVGDGEVVENLNRRPGGAPETGRQAGRFQPGRA